MAAVLLDSYWNLPGNYSGLRWCVRRVREQGGSSEGELTLCLQSGESVRERKVVPLHEPSPTHAAWPAAARFEPGTSTFQIRKVQRGSVCGTVRRLGGLTCGSLPSFHQLLGFPKSAHLQGEAGRGVRTVAGNHPAPRLISGPPSHVTVVVPDRHPCGAPSGDAQAGLAALRGWLRVVRPPHGY